MHFFKTILNRPFYISKSKNSISPSCPRILSPRILTLISLYSLAFTLLLCSIKMLRLEHQAASSASQLANTSARIASEDSAREIQQNIASQIIRLHVIANSDMQNDQNLKLMVRDSVIEDMQSALKDASSVNEARNILIKAMPQIQRKAEETIQTAGYDYPVSLSLNKRYFPVKVYGDLTFPAGEYEALCLEIGKASGRNWWCVLFPSLCFVDETYAVVPDESKEKLQDSLSEEEYATLENQEASKENNETGVELRSGFLDWMINR